MSEDKKEAVLHRFYNTTDSPVLMDDDGHTLGGFEHGPFDPMAEPTMKALAEGRLIDKGPVKEDDPESQQQSVAGTKNAPQEDADNAEGTKSNGDKTDDKSNKSAKGRTSGKVK